MIASPPSPGGLPSTAKGSVAMVIIALIVAELASAFETLMLYAAMGKLVILFDPLRAGWLVTIYLLVQTASAALGGRLGDLFGRRRLLIISLFISGCGSLLSFFAVNYPMLLVGRAFQGCAGAVLPLCFGLAYQHLPARWASMGVGIVAATASLGAGLALLTGGYIVDNFDWHHIFSLGAVLAAAGVVAAKFGLPASLSRPAAKVDVVGGILFVPAICLILLALTLGGRTGWTSYTTIGMAVGGILLCMWWIRYELRHPEPLLDVRMLAVRSVSASNAVMFFLALGAVQLPLILPLFLSQPHGGSPGLSATAIGLVMMPSMLMAVAVSPLAGSLLSVMTERRLAVCAVAIVLAGWVLIGLSSGQLGVVVGGVILVGVGMAAAMAIFPNIVLAHTPAARHSEAGGMLTVVRGLGQSVGSQLIALLIATRGVATMGLTGVDLVLAYAAGTVAVALLLAATLLTNRRLPTATIGSGA
ncbi:hypothetical protein BSL82_11940 [Tardibacter chloracetimidivorans]|uniref:Major facilitator superfamily (MFS) profile domain-containing protein n=1 Tax=Tardibacter chloracetimidivorans TaxID=1921510 RepID=A0A1L3ZWC9_9SPHN|nr:MFS transporter [Tardibacter chloracetimidivorans]API59933.1 hypothetical protein BSL82_11940 [Tardibacter chloracetimidivorans]